jgi:hypothetical protein
MEEERKRVGNKEMCGEREINQQPIKKDGKV